jgi:hypothetical protein
VGPEALRAPVFGAQVTPEEELNEELEAAHEALSKVRLSPLLPRLTLMVIMRVLRECGWTVLSPSGHEPKWFDEKIRDKQHLKLVKK